MNKIYKYSSDYGLNRHCGLLMGINVNNFSPSENICELCLAIHYWLPCFCGAVIWLGHCHCYLYHWEIIKRWHRGWQYRQMSGCKYQLICNMFVSSGKIKINKLHRPIRQHRLCLLVLCSFWAVVMKRHEYCSSTVSLWLSKILGGQARFETA